MSAESANSDESSKSARSSTSSLEINNFLKSCSWLNDLIELHYFPYNSCNSLTIYSYKYWSNENKILVGTKENNVKEVYFKTCFCNLFTNDESSVDITGIESILSTRSSVSSNASNNHQNTFTSQEDGQTNRKNSVVNSTNITDDKSVYSANETEFLYLEPVIKVHKLSKSKADACVSSLDIFDVNNFSVLVVAFVIKRKPEFFVNIYCDFETKNLDLMIECEREFELSTMPHRVTNINLIKMNDNEQKSETCIFVNSSQKTNYLYMIDIKNRKFDLIEKIESIFIEFNSENFSDNCTSHDMKYLSSTKSNIIDRRLTAIGCQNGLVGVYLIDMVKNEILKFWEQEHDSFITQLQFFTIKSTLDWLKLDFDKINLLVLRSLEPTRIYNNVIYGEDDFESYQDLEINANYDLVTSAVVYDATFSGFNSIVLGTFGKALLFFCPIPTVKDEEIDKQATLTLQSDLSNLEQSFKIENESRRIKPKFSYELKRETMLKNSILGLSTGLFSNNGALDLAAFTLNGISIWQYDPDKVIDLVNKLVEKKGSLNILDSSCL
ncbi:unnamed protein product [Brachionus calyciflorus]|uniref:Uncharacterized protein n=1 Tax=Brachionus calyciflorus TaxID=104777 RepID=A0A813M275_9BILA|nr:unnamed protein product [Brachionus calyciflorus]